MLIGNARPARSMTIHRHNLLSPHFLEDQSPLPGTLYRRGAVSGTRDGRPVSGGWGALLEGITVSCRKTEMSTNNYNSKFKVSGRYLPSAMDKKTSEEQLILVRISQRSILQTSGL